MIYRHKDGRTVTTVQGSYQETLLKSSKDWKQDKAKKAEPESD